MVRTNFCYFNFNHFSKCWADFIHNFIIPKDKMVLFDGFQKLVLTLAWVLILQEVTVFLTIAYYTTSIIYVKLAICNMPNMSVWNLQNSARNSYILVRSWNTWKRKQLKDGDLQRYEKQTPLQLVPRILRQSKYLAEPQQN